MFYNTCDQYHPDVVEFFLTITYLRGRGPMFFGQGLSFDCNSYDVCMN